MERIEYRDVVDKTTWPRGEWDNEPDKIQWQDEATGMPCIIRRHPNGGFLCGYVGVPDSHPWHGRAYNESPDGPDSIIETHYGLTYSDPCDPAEADYGICHKPGEGEPDHVWWFGFDCAHYLDMSPGYRSLLKGSGLPPIESEIYRNVEYVAEECRNLAKQLSEHGSGGGDSS